MQINVLLDGITYKSMVSDEDAEKISEAHYQNKDEVTRMKMTLESGDIMVLGRDACEKAVYIYKP